MRTDRLEPQVRGQGAQASHEQHRQSYADLAEVSAGLFIVLVIHIERSMRSAAITTRATKTPSSDSSSSLGSMAVDGRGCRELLCLGGPFSSWLGVSRRCSAASASPGRPVLQGHAAGRVS